jgi:galactose-1-phosphate uridylyltransferase
MNAIAPFHGTAIVTAGRPDIRAMMQHFTAPYRAAVPFEDLIQTVKLNSTPARRSKNQRLSAAMAIRKAVAGHIGAVRKAVEYLSVAMIAPDEEDVRQILGAMMLVFHSQPTQTSGFFIDTLVMELREPEQIAAECRDLIAQHSLDPVVARTVITKGLLGDQPLPLK